MGADCAESVCSGDVVGGLWLCLLTDDDDDEICFLAVHHDTCIHGLSTDASSQTNHCFKSHFNFECFCF